jgi:hypothetical protein
VNERHADSDESYERRVRMGKDVVYRPLSREELDKLAGEPLPERAAMSLINANVAAPINAAGDLNVDSDDSVAYANTTRNATIRQEN